MKSFTETTALYTAARANIYAGGWFMAEDSPDPFLTNTSFATQLRITDQVGSLRGLSDLGNPKGYWSGAWTSFPYGDGAVAGDGGDSGDLPGGLLFTGKKRDAETGLDYFGARYYSSAMGRFLSPDYSDSGDPIPYADISNPQSLNLYAYVLNSPLLTTDEDGHSGGCGGEYGDDTEVDSDKNVTYHKTFDHTGDCPSPEISTWTHVFDQAFSTVQSFAQDTMRYLAAPRNLGCLGSMTAGSSMAGAVYGLAGGPAAGVTVPTGFVEGGIAGFATGMTTCMTGGGGSGGGGNTGSSARLTKPQQRQTAKSLGMKEVKGLTSQGQPVFEKSGRYFSFSNTSHAEGEVFKEVDRSGGRIATTDLNFNRIGP